MFSYSAVDAIKWFRVCRALAKNGSNLFFGFSLEIRERLTKLWNNLTVRKRCRGVPNWLPAEECIFLLFAQAVSSSTNITGTATIFKCLRGLLLLSLSNSIKRT